MRRRRLLVPALLLGIALVATACGGGGRTPVDPNEDRAEESPSPQQTRTAEQSDEVLVDTVDFAYVPQEVTVAPGTTVTFTNSDAVAHTVTADDGSFDSGTMNEGDTWSYTFTEPGEYPYYCIPHPFMTGTVIVKE